MTSRDWRELPRRALLSFGLCAVAWGLTGEVRAESPKKPADKPLQVVTTLPILAQVTRAIGGSLVEVESLADPRQNPHFVEPRPTLMQRARRAEVFVEVGLQLEPWARRVTVGSGNSRIQFGQPGYVVCSSGITTLQVPTQVTREAGNIHPYGNPYVWLDPLNLKRIAENIAEGLARVDVAHKAEYTAGLEAFNDRIDRALFGDALVDEIGGSKLDRLARQGRLNGFLEQRGLRDKLGGWLAKAEPLAGTKIISHHQTWVYFADRFGFQVALEIEEKPGIQPSAKHRQRVLETMREDGIKLILIETYQDRRTADWLAKRTGAKVRVVPVDVGPQVPAGDYFELIDLLLNKLLPATGAETGQGD